MDSIFLNPMEFPLQSDGTPAYARTGDKELWVMLLEKAYAQYKGSYKKIDSGYVDKAIGVITGTNAKSYRIKKYSEEEIVTIIKEALDNKKPVVADSKSVPKGKKKLIAEVKKLGIIDGHSYPVKTISATTIDLQNPWTDDLNNYDISLSIADFKTYFNDFNIQE